MKLFFTEKVSTNSYYNIKSIKHRLNTNFPFEYFFIVKSFQLQCFHIHKHWIVGDNQHIRKNKDRDNSDDDSQTDICEKPQRCFSRLRENMLEKYF